MKDNLVGRRFGQLEVIEKSKKKSGYYVCRCDCGKITEVYGSNLRDGKTRSCGCYRANLCRDLGKRAIRANSARRLAIIAKYGTNYSSIMNPNLQINNKTGHRGVCKTKSGSYQAYIGFRKQHYYLGTYKSLDDAVEARQKAEKEIFLPIIEEIKADVAAN